MDVKEILKKVRRIEIKTRRLSDHIFSGEYHSSFKGRGMAFSEVRPYQFGDDVRTIDWNVTAKTNEPYVKVFEEERELTLLLAVDISGSQNFGTGINSKREIITELCATLAFSAINTGDKVGLLLFSDEVELFIPPAKGRSHVLRIIRELIEFEPKSLETNISETFRFISAVQKKKAIVFAISDFIDNDYKDALRIAARKHEVTGIRVYDNAEYELPKLGLVQMRNAETGEYIWADTSTASTKNAYKTKFLEHANYFSSSFKLSGAGTISCSTNDDYVKKLLAYFRTK